MGAEPATLGPYLAAALDDRRWARCDVRLIHDPAGPGAPVHALAPQVARGHAALVGVR